MRRKPTLEERVARLERKLLKESNYAEFEAKIDRYIQYIVIDLVKKDLLSDDDIEDLRNEDAQNVYISEYNMWIVDYVIEKLKEAGYSIEEIEEYGIRSIREMLCDCVS